MGMYEEVSQVEDEIKSLTGENNLKAGTSEHGMVWLGVPVARKLVDLAKTKKDQPVSNLRYFGFDTETDLIGPQNIAGRLICLSVSTLIEGIYEDLLLSNGDELLDTMIMNVLEDETIILVGHNTAYDLAVLARRCPACIPLIFKRLENFTIKDTMIREKMMDLASTGDMAFRENRDGSKSRIEYGLAPLVFARLGRNRVDEKTVNDAWRLNYVALDGKPADQWPVDARKYVIDDSRDSLELFFNQEARRARFQEERGFDPLKAEWHKVMAAFCLFLITIEGMEVDPEALAKFEAEVQKELTPDKLSLIIKAGILRPEQPARPYKNGAKNPDGTPKMVAPEPASINTTALKAYVEDLCKRKPDVCRIVMTEPSDRFPNGQISTADEVMQEYAKHDPVMAEYAHRQSVQKFVTTEIPRMKWYDEAGNRTVPSPVVHFPFDVLKETGRTSSKATDLYPSANGQNIHPKARNCYRARKGKVLCSNDYEAMELGTAGQVCYSLFGFSVLRDKINAGIDTHAYLGAQLAFRLQDAFRAVCEESGILMPDQVYEAFASLKKAPEEEAVEFYNHYRKFAKPTGLGYPGGLGAETFIAYAKATYGVEVTLEQAESFKKIWKDTYTEFVPFFKHINQNCVDPYNVGKRKNKDTGEIEEYNLYCYTTPLGLHRAGCDYCACANGMALQSPSAEGALLGLFFVTRACYDHTQGSILFGTTKVVDFIHDELLTEFDEDGLMTERSAEIGRLMVEGMRLITPDVEARTAGALMRVWDKNAKPVFSADGKLQVWTPAVA